jgi:citrate lyase subunit beta / citryl-CoA lyase
MIVTASRWPLPAASPGRVPASGLTQETSQAVALGFAGKAGIHPDQIAPIHAALTPRPEEVAQARRILAAAGASQSASVSSDRSVEALLHGTITSTLTNSHIA